MCATAVGAPCLEMPQKVDALAKVAVSLVLEIITTGTTGFRGEVDMELECDCRRNLRRKSNGSSHAGKCCGATDFTENK